MELYYSYCVRIPGITAPLNKDTGMAATTFSNGQVAGAASYRLQVSAFSNFSVLDR
jgi:hypothetical protein